jgi:hypothetical protein
MDTVMVMVMVMHTDTENIKMNHQLNQVVLL